MAEGVRKNELTDPDRSLHSRANVSRGKATAAPFPQADIDPQFQTTIDAGRVAHASAKTISEEAAVAPTLLTDGVKPDGKGEVRKSISRTGQSISGYVFFICYRWLSALTSARLKDILRLPKEIGFGRQRTMCFEVTPAAWLSMQLVLGTGIAGSGLCVLIAAALRYRGAIPGVVPCVAGDHSWCGLLIQSIWCFLTLHRAWQAIGHSLHALNFRGNSFTKAAIISGFGAVSDATCFMAEGCVGLLLAAPDAGATITTSSVDYFTSAPFSIFLAWGVIHSVAHPIILVFPDWYLRTIEFRSATWASFLLIDVMMNLWALQTNVQQAGNHPTTTHLIVLASILYGLLNAD